VERRLPVQRIQAMQMAPKDPDRFDKYVPDHGYDPRLVQLREYVCPGCGALLDVEAVPPGTPVLFDSLADIETFYRDWLQREPPIPGLRAEDRSQQVVNRWAREADQG